MATRLEYKTYTDFKGGQQTFTSPLWQNENECALAQNIDISRPGILMKTDGYKNLGTNTSGGAVKGLWVYADSIGSKIPIKVYDTKIERYLPNKWETISTSLTTSSTKAEAVNAFIDGEDRMYITYGLENELFYCEGKSIETPTHDSGATNLYGKHIAYYKNSLYIANLKITESGTSTFYPIRLLFSNVGTDEFNLTDNYIDDMGEPITALKVFNEKLYVFSESHIASYDTSNLRFLPGTYGTTSAQSVQESLGRLFWFNQSGVYMTTGAGIPELISRGVQPYIDAITSASAVNAGIDRDGKYNIYIGDVVVEGESKDDVVLVYDPTLNSWEIKTGRAFSYFATKLDDGGVSLYAGSNANDQVYEVGVGTSNAGSNIESVWRTGLIDNGDPQNVKRYHELYVTYEPQERAEYITVKYRLDGSGDFQSFADSTDSVSTTTNNISLASAESIKNVKLTFPPNAEGNFLELEFSHTSSAGGFKIYEYGIKYGETDA